MGMSSSWDLCDFSWEENADSRSHWNKNLCKFLEEDKIGVHMLLLEIVQS